MCFVFVVNVAGIICLAGCCARGGAGDDVIPLRNFSSCSFGALLVDGVVEHASALFCRSNGSVA